MTCVPGALEPVGDLRAVAVVDADDRRLAAGHQPLLDRGIVLHRAVAVEMVGRQVEQDAGRRIDRRREVDLVGRAFDDIVAGPAVGGSSVSTARPILPPICASRPADFRICAISAVVVDLPLVPVMAMNGASGACARALAREQLDIADDLDAGAARQFDGPVRLGMRQRHAGRQHEGRKARPVRRRADRRSRCRSPRPCATLSGLSSQASTSRAARHQRTRRREPRAAEAEERDASCRRRSVTGIIGAHLSLRVDRPTSARMTAMIQKRITTWLSVQPSFSK